MIVASQDLEHIRDLYHRSLYVQAYKASEKLGPITAWEGAEARLLAGRLAMNLGGVRLGYALHMSAYRAYTDDSVVQYYYARGLLNRRGPLESLRMLDRISVNRNASTPLRADILSAKAAALALLRDFHEAERCIEQSLKLSPERPWLHVERSFVLECEDRHEEALEAARQSLAIHDSYRPGIQAFAHLCVLMSRDDEAVELLTETANRLESCLLVSQLASIRMETENYQEAGKCLERFEQLAPLMDRDTGNWLRRWKADIAYMCGDRDQAIEYARGAKSPFHEKVNQHLASAKDYDGRHQLAVGFIRQHHATCVPATLTAISRFWNKPADHLEVAEKICYDGTSAYNERKWAGENGWIAREFTITWDTITALIGRGVPFTFTLVDPGNAHMQAIIGYDSARKTILARDPYVRIIGEYLADETLTRYEASGPRGMVLVPVEKADLIEGIDLPDADFYDPNYDLQDALERHDRARASAVMQIMESMDPKNRVTLLARYTLAHYDDDASRRIACLDDLLEKYPHNAVYQLARLSQIQEFSRRSERVKILTELCGEKDTAYVFRVQYARELRIDAQEHDKAKKLLVKAIRTSPRGAEAYYELAGLYWNQRRFDEALQLYRMAACLEDKNESYAQSYFTAGRNRKKADTVIGFLRDRCERYGSKSCGPACTLAWAFEQLERTAEAFEVYAQALKLRPDDGFLWLQAADAHARYGNFAKAGQCLAESKGKASDSLRLRKQASIQYYQGDFVSSLVSWKTIAEQEPHSVESHRSVAALMAKTEGREQAINYLRQVADRFPSNFSFHQFLASYLRESNPQESEKAIQQLITIDPADAWSRRERAMLLAERGELDEAHQEWKVARSLAPLEPETLNIEGYLCAKRGHTEEAKKAFRKALAMSVDTEYAINQLLMLCQSGEEKRACLMFIQKEMVRQVILGDCLLAFRQQAKGLLDPEEVLDMLKDAHEARPDLWQSWAALLQQLVSMFRTEEALRAGREMTERFPLVPNVWTEYALVHRATLDRSSEIEAYERAIELSPSWGWAVRQLCELYEKNGDFQRSRNRLEQAVAQSPVDAFNHGCLASVLWRMNEKQHAFDRLKQAVLLEPEYAWAWQSLSTWASEFNKPDVPEEIARELTTKRPGSISSWLNLASVLGKPTHLQERLDALDKAIGLDPLNTDAYDKKAVVLCEVERYEEALDACAPRLFGDRTPLPLCARAVWIGAHVTNDAASAAAEMEKLVAESPDFFWGWTLLADWYRTLQRHDKYLWAAEAVKRLAPLSHMSYGYLGEAKMLNGDREGGLRELEQAFDLEPDYVYAGYTVFDEQLKAGDHAKAERTLKTLEQQVNDEYTKARAIQLAAAQHDAKRVKHGFHQLCMMAFEDPWPLRAVADVMANSEWHELFEEVTQAAIATPRVNNLVIAVAAS